MQDAMLREIISDGNADQERRDAENYRFMEEQKIKKALAPAQWEEFKQTLEESCQRVGASSPVALAFEFASPNEAMIRNLRTGRLASLRYDPSVPCIHYELPTKRGHYAFRVSPDGTWLQIMDGPLARLTGELAVAIIRSVR